MENVHYEKKNKLPKALKIILWVLVCIFTILIVTIAGSVYLQGKFPERLKTAVFEKSQGQYHLDFDEMSVSLLKGSINLKNVKLNIDTLAYVKHLTPESSDHLIQINASELNLSGINFFQYLTKGNVLLKEILLDKPTIVLYQMRDTLKKDSIERNLYNQLPDFLKGTKLSLLKVNDLSFSKRKSGHLQDSVSKLTGLSFSIEDIAIDSSAMQDSSIVWFSKDIKISSQGLRYTLANGLYFFKIEKLNASTKNKTLDIEVFKVIPLYKELEFSHKLGKQGDRYNILVPQIKIKDIDFKKLETEKSLFAQSVILENGQVLIFNNKKLPSEPKNVIRKAPHMALQRLKFPIFIDSLFIKNFEVHYRELNPNSNEVGDVFFTNLTGTIKNVTNDSIVLQKNHWVTSTFEMNFLGNAKINVDINLNVSSKVGEFNYKGSLGPASAISFNKLLEPMALVKAESGHFNKVSFDVKANENGSSGTVQVLYKDLKVSLLVKEDSGKIGRAGLASFLANSFLITPNNPEEGEPARISHFTYKHYPNHSFFNLMWKSIFTGIKENVIESKAQKKELKKISKEKKREEKQAEKEAKAEKSR
jgi:hypothetical protein